MKENPFLRKRCQSCVPFLFVSKRFVYDVRKTLSMSAYVTRSGVGSLLFGSFFVSVQFAVVCEKQCAVRDTVMRSESVCLSLRNLGVL
jgi:hypothetical protein